MAHRGSESTDAGPAMPLPLTTDDVPPTPYHEESSKRERLVGLTKTSIAKVKELKPSLKIASKVSPGEAMLGGMDHDPAFSTQSLHEEIRANEKEKSKEPSEILKTIGKGVIHPKQTIKNHATQLTAGKLSTVGRSFVSQEADLELLHAHDELANVEKNASSKSLTADSITEGMSIEECRTKVKELEQQRESLRAAWITNHQVFRVRVVPSKPYQAPATTEPSSNFEDGRWLKETLQLLGRGLLFYLQDLCTMYVDDSREPHFDVATLKTNIERLVIASAAWQSWLYDIRTIYRWENPLRTGAWLAIFLFLWYTEHVVGFLYSYILYIVVRNRYAPTSIQSMRESIERAADNRSKATRFVELIDKHGAQNWIDAVVEEILVNFYEWRAPYRTVATLSFFAACLAVTCVADMAFCVKLVWFVAGGTFFFLWPIASLYPQYRALVSPIRWVFWEIPTHAEWAFQYLRLHAQERREQIITQRISHKATDLSSAVSQAALSPEHTSGETDSSDDAELDPAGGCKANTHLGDEDIRSFRAVESLVPGRLILSTNGIRFIRKLSGAEDWRLPFVKLSMMWKAKSNFASKFKSARGQLVIQDISGQVRILEGIRESERDDAFNNIIAFSGLRWQNLQ